VSVAIPEKSASPTSSFRVGSIPTPVWLDRTLATSDFREITIDKLCIQIYDSENVSLLKVKFPGLSDLAGDALTDAVCQCYRNVGELVRARNARPIRFWNFIPGILRRHSNGMSSYEYFNSGRFDALRSWMGEIAAERLAVATAVGAPGDDYLLHVLIDSHPARPIENPRQISPHCYSKRYGPVPPVFARACILTPSQRNLLGCSALVSGTASIVGEDTEHRGDLAGQIDETCRNLASLSNALAGKEAVTLQDALDRYDALRVYVPHVHNHAEVRDRFQEIFRVASALEFVQVDLCRPDLLLEVEGTLSFPE
jgi:chorismate lyase/3-hydroxybenzoate synthase